ncbi:MAG: HAMP domain-containing histidine kinase [Eubacterium sp.]|nr:HAMP domain-containing histidine kinase [Eubacterium sp.]
MKLPKILRSTQRSKIFKRYYIVFAVIFMVTFAALATSLLVLVNSYEINDKTELLKENTQSIAETVASNLYIYDMNAKYSAEKVLLCDQLSVVSACIDSDVFVCDVEGNIIMCKERSAQLSSYYAASMVCEDHSSFKIDDALIQSVYENGMAVTKADVNGVSCYVVGTAVIAPDYSYFSEGANVPIGSVFAVVEEGTTQLVLNVVKTFAVIALICLSVGFMLIWLTTRKMVTPLQQMSAAAKRFAVGDFSYRVKVESDDELADLGNAFNDMAEALDKLESSRRSFVANVSHELKTPMTSIAGFIDGILDGTIPRTKQDYYLKIVSDEVRRLSRLVVAMLNMSKMESGDFEMKPRDYSLTDQIIHILLTFEQKIDAKHIEIRGLETLGQYRVHADTDMIYQVIYNLCDNAVKFTNDGGYIAISVRDQGEMLEVTVKNSGEGIKSDELSKIFERFYKVDKSRSLDAKGAGLGLYIVKIMVEMHGGKIFARSDSVSEAEFVFTLPKAKS